VSVSPRFGDPILIPYNIMGKISAKGYRVTMELSEKGEVLVLSGLGYNYDDFVRILSGFRSEVAVSDQLMAEGKQKLKVACEFRLKDSGGAKRGGRCECRLYETALVVMPEKGDYVRMPYSGISSISEGKHAISVRTLGGSELEVSMLGDAFTLFSDALSNAYGDVQLRAQKAIHLFVPELGVQELRKAAALMKEGRAAKKSELEAAVPGLWDKLEARLKDAELLEGYGFLKPLGNVEKACIGFKEGTMPGLSSSYIWFMVPIYGAGPGKPGNAVAMEAAVGQGGGKATYFFRIFGRGEYARLKRAEMDGRVDEFLSLVNQCMLDINFRRVPIYLPEEELGNPKYAKYKWAVEKMPGLRTLRNCFIGRVMHASKEGWKRDVTELLSFNASSKDDAEKWRKEEPQEEYVEDEPAEKAEGEETNEGEGGEDADEGEKDEGKR
jgi:hypothetical protein